MEKPSERILKSGRDIYLKDLEENDLTPNSISELRGFLSITLLELDRMQEEIDELKKKTMNVLYKIIRLIVLSPLFIVASLLLGVLNLIQSESFSEFIEDYSWCLNDLWWP